MVNANVIISEFSAARVWHYLYIYIYINTYSRTLFSFSSSGRCAFVSPALASLFAILYNKNHNFYAMRLGKRKYKWCIEKEKKQIIEKDGKSIIYNIYIYNDHLFSDGFGVTLPSCASCNRNKIIIIIKFKKKKKEKKIIKKKKIMRV